MASSKLRSKGAVMRTYSLDHTQSSFTESIPLVKKTRVGDDFESYLTSIRVPDLCPCVRVAYMATTQTSLTRLALQFGRKFENRGDYHKHTIVTVE